MTRFLEFMGELTLLQRLLGVHRLFVSRHIKPLVATFPDGGSGTSLLHGGTRGSSIP